MLEQGPSGRKWQLQRYLHRHLWLPRVVLLRLAQRRVILLFFLGCFYKQNFVRPDSHLLLTSVSFAVNGILPRDELKMKHPGPCKQCLRYLCSPVCLQFLMGSLAAHSEFTDELRKDKNDNHREEQAIDAVEDTPMAWYELSTIFNVCLPFDKRFSKVTERSSYTNQNTQQHCQVPC